MSSDELEARLARIAGESKVRFDRENSILSFQQYFEQLHAHPYRLTRYAPQYLADMMDFFGTDEVKGVSGPTRRFRVFDDPTGDGSCKVVGQESVQNEIYRTLREFAQRRRVDRLIMLHGPNGSSKTTTVAALVRGLEAYSHSDEGVLLRFSWIFSEGADRGESLGFNPVSPDEELETFAFLEPERISCKIPCELKDDPIFLIPREHREKVLGEALAAAPPEEQRAFVRTRYLIEGDLSPKSKRIYDALLKAYHGDWKKVVRHVQVERYYVSKRFRVAAVTIEPQANIDAQSRQIGHATMNGLPAVLQNDSLFECFGDLVDANGGIVEYSDFFKRPLEANKYLLTTAENGTISLQSFAAHLNLVLIGTSNENYLTAFRRDPMFSSFKARLELVRVPYLLQIDREEEIYRRQIADLPAGVSVAPHATRIAAIWSVLTRLMEPLSNVDDAVLRRVLERLTPIEKAKLYNDGEPPSRLSAEEAARLRQHLPRMSTEYDTHEEEFEGMWDAAYEGRRGCSPREMLMMLSEIAMNPPGDCVTPLLILRAIPELTRDPSLFEFLRLQRTRNGYHDCAVFIAESRHEYLALLRDDVLAAAELIDEQEYGRLLRRYFAHVKAHETKQKVQSETRGPDEQPDAEFMARIEGLLNADSDTEAFRSGLMAKAAAFRLDNPDAPFVFDDVFADLLRRLRENFFRERLDKVRRLVEDALTKLSVRAGKLDEERAAAAERFVERMTGAGYSKFSLIEALGFFLESIEQLG